MGALPGQRVLIFISPGFLTPTADAMTLKSQVLDMAARGNVIISAIDARGLYTTNLTRPNKAEARRWLHKCRTNTDKLR